MDFIRSPFTQYDEADPRDSDLAELPFAKDASQGNVAMLLTIASPFVAIALGLVLAVVTK